MNSKEEKHQEEISRLFGAQLNSHGYGFHFRVIKEATNLANQRDSLWRFVASEVPVSVRGEDTRIDFVMKRAQSPAFYLLAECKRANPALSNWCFAKSPYVHVNRADNLEQVMIECLELFDSPAHTPKKFKSAATKWASAPNVCHIALDIKASEQGDKHDSGRNAIERAASQIMRGLNGMVELLPQHPEMFRQHRILFLPVIFTTAKLWLSDADLSSADLETGKIDFSDAGFKRVDWVSYQYHLSPGIKHSYWMGNGPSELPDLMDLDFIRTIPIVSPEGLGSFLQWSSFRLDVSI